MVGKRRPQLAEGFERCVRARAFVRAQLNRFAFALRDQHRDDLLRQPS
jgi:hypothetical protein